MRCEYCGKETRIYHLCPGCGSPYCLEHRDPAVHDCSSRAKSRRETESQRTRSPDKPVKKKPRELVINFIYPGSKKSKSKQIQGDKQEQVHLSPPDKTTPKKTEKAAKFSLLDPEQRGPDRADGPPAEPFKPPLKAGLSGRALTQSAVFDGARKRFFAAAFIFVLAEEALRLASYATHTPFSAYLDGNIYVKFLYQTVDPYVASLIVFVLVCALLFLTTKLASDSHGSSNLEISLVKGAVPIGIFTVVSAIYIFSIANWIVILTS